MPEFEVTVPTDDPMQRDRAIGALPRRFPEVTVIARRAAGEFGEVWTCKAPTASHLERWIDETQIETSSVCLVERIPLRPLGGS